MNEMRMAVETVSSPPWIELPGDVTANILQRLGAQEILESAQKVCTTWQKVCLDPAIWRLIQLDCPNHKEELHYLMCRCAVDRSQGQLTDLKISRFGDDELIHYIVDRSSNLQRLTLASCDDVSGTALSEAVKKLPQLEELHLIKVDSIRAKDVEAIGISCPMLKSFSYHWSSTYPGFSYHWSPIYLGEDEPKKSKLYNEYALAIGKTMPNIRHLQLLSNRMTNEGLEAILDGCPHLESLDIRKCSGVDLTGALRKRCSQQIKNLRDPCDRISEFSWFGVGESSDLECSSWCSDFSLGSFCGCDHHFNCCSCPLDPALYRVINLRNPENFEDVYSLMCRRAVDLSQGQLIDLSIEDFGEEALIDYIANRASHLQRLTIAHCYEISGTVLSEAVKKLPQLEELHLIMVDSICATDIEAIGISCPLLKSFSYHWCDYPLDPGTELPPASKLICNEYALAIVKTMPNLRHLKLLANWMTNEGLEAILDGCSHLESLDIRKCSGLDLTGALGERCYEQIQNLRGPSEAISNLEWLGAGGELSDVKWYAKCGNASRSCRCDVCLDCYYDDFERVTDLDFYLFNYWAS